MANMFYIRQSSIGQFYACPARYAFSRKYDYVGPVNWWLRDGSQAHALMAGGRPDVVEPSDRALLMYQRMSEYVDNHQYTIIEKEVFQVVPVTRVISLVRTVDALVYDKDHIPMLLDYKFTGRPWSTIEATGWGPNLAPQAMGFQSKAYLHPPKDPTPFKKWPSIIRFLICDDKEGIQIRSHESIRRPNDAKDLTSALRTIKHAWDKDHLPINAGFMCAKYCDFRQICFQEPGYSDLYELNKDKHPYEKPVRGDNNSY